MSDDIDGSDSDSEEQSGSFDDDFYLDERHEDINKHRYLVGHEQRDTYSVIMQKDDNLTVPNFVGGSLPHCDRGDRKYYCSAMLTFF